jgi:stress-induced-phosphoprotein 1
MSSADFKNLGNQAFKEKKFEESVQLYSKAIELNPSDHVLYSNRSGAYASLSNYEEAEKDAVKCI